ncbi:MAG: hypothetical protein EXR51_12005, partial [Dehalococcoidia bacterium]|nr:hypothetical protein [Dehalococcoidia bacterium]
FYENFCRSIGREDWLEHEQAGPEAHAAMIAAARDIFRTKTREAWFDLLNQTDQCAMRVLEPAEMANDPHVRAREMIVDLPHPTLGTVHQTGFAPKLSKTPGGFRNFAASTGQHTQDVLAGLGLSAADIEELRASGAIR